MRTISVTGEASLTAANDTARVGFGVEGRGATHPVALRTSSANLRRVLTALRRLGVADPDLRTRGVSVARRRDRRGRRLPGYIARGGVSVVVRDVTQTGAVVDAAIAAGAASVDGPSFSSTIPKHSYVALVAAFGDARSKAAALAAEAELALGRTISIRESTFVPTEIGFFDAMPVAGVAGSGAAPEQHRPSLAAPGSPAPSTWCSRPSSA